MGHLQTDMTAMIGGMDQMVSGMSDMNAEWSPDGRSVPADGIGTATMIQQTLQTIDSTFGGIFIE